MSLEKKLKKMSAGSDVTFSELLSVCEHYFGRPRIKGSHHVFKTPWPADPRVNIQKSKGKAKKYQVRQVMAAIRKLEEGVK